MAKPIYDRLRELEKTGIAGLSEQNMMKVLKLAADEIEGLRMSIDILGPRCKLCNDFGYIQGIYTLQTEGFEQDQAKIESARQPCPNGCQRR